MAVNKDAAFYRKQREDDEAKAKKGDKKAQGELSKINAKRAKQRPKSTASSKNWPSAGIGSGRAAQSVKSAAQKMTTSPKARTSPKEERAASAKNWPSPGMGGGSVAKKVGGYLADQRGKGFTMGGLGPIDVGAARAAKDAATKKSGDAMRTKTAMKKSSSSS